MTTEIHTFGTEADGYGEQIHKSENEGDRNFMAFDCPPPATPYAPPQQRWCILEGINFDLDIDVLRDFFLKKEQWVIDNYDHEEITAPQAPQLTQRLRHYNIFEWEDECPELTKLRRVIKKFHKEYGKKVWGNTYRYDQKLYIRAWLNVLREGEEIGMHIHSTHPHSYIAGHFTVTCDDSQTIYCHPLYQLPDGYRFYSNNKPGTLTLFPSTVPHCTSVQKTNIPRVTIAFDLTPLTDPGSVLLPL